MGKRSIYSVLGTSCCSFLFSWKLIFFHGQLIHMIMRLECSCQLLRCRYTSSWSIVDTAMFSQVSVLRQSLFSFIYLQVVQNINMNMSLDIAFLFVCFVVLFVCFDVFVVVNVIVIVQVHIFFFVNRSPISSTT